MIESKEIPKQVSRPYIYIYIYKNVCVCVEESVNINTPNACLLVTSCLPYFRSKVGSVELNPLFPSFLSFFLSFFPFDTS